MMCDHCDKPLAPAEADTHPIYGASGSGGTVHIHKGGCPPSATRPRDYPVDHRR